MIYEFNPSISKMDELKAEVQVLLPVLKAAREELGEAQSQRAHPRRITDLVSREV
jgi:hypothetical protein